MPFICLSALPGINAWVCVRTPLPLRSWLNVNLWPRGCTAGEAVMKLAEELYQAGYISYPRTETDCFDPGMDLLVRVHACMGGRARPRRPCFACICACTHKHTCSTTLACTGPLQAYGPSQCACRKRMHACAHVHAYAGHCQRARARPALGRPRDRAGGADHVALAAARRARRQGASAHPPHTPCGTRWGGAAGWRAILA